MRHWPWIAFFIVAGLYLVGLGSYEFSDAEAKYAETPREMIEGPQAGGAGGDWLTPHLDYIRELGRPPLTWWITALGFRAFGMNEFTGRLTNVAFGLALAPVLAAIGTTLFTRRVGLIAAAMWLGTAEVYDYTREVGMEMPLLFWMALAHLAFLKSETRAWRLLCGAALAAAFMSKGPIGVVLPLFAFAAYDWRALGRMWDALLVFIVLASIWPVAMALKHHDFLWYWIVHENIYRFLGKRLPNDSIFPTWKFLALAAGEFFPWILFLPEALVRAIHAMRRREPDRTKLVYMLVWALFPLLLFSISKSKVDFYCLHAFPGLCLLVAWLWERRFGKPAGSMGAACLAASAASASTTALAWLSPRFSAGLPIPAWAGIFLVGAGVAFPLASGLLWRGRHALALGVILLVSASLCAVKGRIYAVEPEPGMAFAAKWVAANAPPDAALVSDERPEFAHVAVLAYYANRKCFLLRDPGPSNLHFTWKEWETAVWDESELVRRVRSGEEIFLVGDRAMISRLFRSGLRLKFVTYRSGRVLFRLSP